MLIVASIVLAMVVGLARGGRLDHLVERRLRAPWLVIAGFALQFAPLPASLPWLLVPLLILSFLCLIEFAALNLESPGFALVLVGVALNFVVITANHGMPVSAHALVASGQQDTLVALVSGAVKHHLAGPHDVLMQLGDVISLGRRVHQIVSVGDLFTYAGVMWFVAASMGRKGRRSTPAPAVEREMAMAAWRNV